MAKAKQLNDMTQSLKPSTLTDENLKEICLDGLRGMKEDGDQAKKYSADKRKGKENLIPMLKALRSRLNRQGKRDGAQGWQAWFNQHKAEFGISLRTVERWLDPKPEEKHKFSNLDPCDGVVINGKKYLINYGFRHGNIVRIDLTKFEAPEKTEAQPEESTPAKKLTAAETAEAIRQTLANFKTDNRDAFTSDWAEHYQKFFEEQVKLHPEWRSQQIQTETHRIERMIAARGVRKPKPVDPAKEIRKRFRLAKRAGKFYAGMMDELNGLNRFQSGGQYAQLLELWGGLSFPYAPPSKGYALPKTVEEFQAEYDKAFGEFHAVMAEGKAMGVLTDAPREPKPTVTETLPDCPVEDETEGFALAAQIQKAVEEN